MVGFALRVRWIMDVPNWYGPNPTLVANTFACYNQNRRPSNTVEGHHKGCLVNKQSNNSYNKSNKVKRENI